MVALMVCPMRTCLGTFALSLATFAVCAGQPPKIVLVGDSTVAAEGGWGPGLKAAFGEDVEVLNRARNGRSSKSFRDEGAWAPVQQLKPQYVLVQFGHNDCPGKGPDRETDPQTTFRANITRYVEDVRNWGGTPILVTSIVRRNFGPDGHIAKDCLTPFVDEIRSLAPRLNVPLMDMHEFTRAQSEKLGPAGSDELGTTNLGKPDRTHLGARGQREIGRLAAQELARAVPALKPLLRVDMPVRMVVAQDGSGDSKTVQWAIDHAPPAKPGQRIVIEIRPGIYRERVTVPQDRPLVTFLGSDAARTVITYDMSAKAAGGTFFSATVNVQGAGFHAENITFENTFGVGSQAVALHIHSDRAVFRNCRFLGWQDTLYAAQGRQYYENCLIEGHVDFIFGNAAAVFEGCELKSRGAGYITAHSRLTPDGPTGYVFLKCRLTGENTGAGVYLGRPWRPYARVVFWDCFLDGHIRPEGWENWRNPENEKTAWYAEFGSLGPGAKPEGRVAWAKPLAPKDTAQFRPEVFLRGADNWDPRVD